MSSLLQSRENEVKFEISSFAAAAIRSRGGCLWIWPSPDGSAYATTEPPGERHEWRDYRQGEFAVHVDRSIEPPQRWTVTLPPNKGRHLEARWNGLDPREAFGLLPLIDPPEEEPTPAKPWYGRIFAGYTLVGVVLWILGIAGLHRSWFDAVPLIWVGFALLVGLLVFAVRVGRQRREDASAP